MGHAEQVSEATGKGGFAAAAGADHDHAL